MDGDFRLDIGEIMKNVKTGEILSFYFVMLRKTLLVDTRYDSVEAPMVRLVPMVDSVEERFRSIKRLRPHFPRPESVTVIPWPKYVDSLVRLGIWDKLLQRFVETGHKEMVRTCSEVLEELRHLEREEVASVIKGDHYHTIWQQRRSR